MRAKKTKAAAEAQECRALVKEGLRRLAFGDSTDAVRLAFLEEPDPAVLDGMQLFHVSELKRSKGSVEVKLFDRFRALEMLAQMAESGPDDQAMEFYQSLLREAKESPHADR